MVAPRLMTSCHMKRQILCLLIWTYRRGLIPKCPLARFRAAFKSADLRFSDHTRYFVSLSLIRTRFGLRAPHIYFQLKMSLLQKLSLMPYIGPLCALESPTQKFDNLHHSHSCSGVCKCGFQSFLIFQRSQQQVWGRSQSWHLQRCQRKGSVHDLTKSPFGYTELQNHGCSRLHPKAEFSHRNWSEQLLLDHTYSCLCSF